MCKEWFVGTFEFPPQIRSQIRRFDGGKICGRFQSPLTSNTVSHSSLLTLTILVCSPHSQRIAIALLIIAAHRHSSIPMSYHARQITALPAPAIDHAHFLHARTVMACTCADAPNTSHENLGTTRRRQLL
ncbi:hypothetical protein C8J57DRAFT_1507713 [Mycena rebaudengoi]|nr:hypothetical protein C8J57DRAFT_1537900 [Mycena rebaudengoi]KAJ7271805.1 hypothetical protein C8J57DRAFT_1507713 [Mycena rebaudengoi]